MKHSPIAALLRMASLLSFRASCPSIDSGKGPPAPTPRQDGQRPAPRRAAAPKPKAKRAPAAAPDFSHLRGAVIKVSPYRKSPRDIARSWDRAMAPFVPTEIAASTVGETQASRGRIRRTAQSWDQFMSPFSVKAESER